MGPQKTPMPDTILRVRVTPRSGKTEVTRVDGGVVYARIAAPPVDGAANSALIKLLADALDVPKSRLSIRSGASGRDKQVTIEGLDEAAAMDRLHAREAKP